MKMDKETLRNAFDIIHHAKCALNFDDYVKIWGKHLGEHIWRQEGSDLIRIWKSGLTPEQKDKFIEYISTKFDGKY